MAVRSFEGFWRKESEGGRDASFESLSFCFESWEIGVVVEIDGMGTRILNEGIVDPRWKSCSLEKERERRGCSTCDATERRRGSKEAWCIEYRGLSRWRRSGVGL